MTSDPTPAMLLEAEAAHWLQRRHFWVWSEADQSELDAWLAQSAAHRVAYWRLKAGFTRSSRLTALDAGASFGRPSLPAQTGRFRFFMGLAAASLALAAILGVSTLPLAPQTEGQLYETQVGGRQTIVLTDGSKIDLNTGTAVRVKGRSAQVLRGEAFFQITHDEARPFVVTADNHRIIDLGTKFSVRTGKAGLEVALIEGRARIEAPHTSARSAVLNPGDVALATATKISVSRKSQQDLSGELGWRRGVLVFHNTRLEAAAEEFNRYNQRKLIIADSAAARLTIGATFPTDDIEAFARTAKNVFGLRVENHGDDIVISH